jgi:hypothetical protein
MYLRTPPASGSKDTQLMHQRHHAMIPQMLQLSSTTNVALSSTAGDKFSSRVVKQV